MSRIAELARLRNGGVGRAGALSEIRTGEVGGPAAGGDVWVGRRA